MNLHSLAVCLGSRDNAANSLSLSLSLPGLSEGLKRPLFLPIFHLALAARVINTRVAFSLFLPTFPLLSLSLAFALLVPLGSSSKTPRSYTRVLETRSIRIIDVRTSKSSVCSRSSDECFLVEHRSVGNVGNVAIEL